MDVDIVTMKKPGSTPKNKMYFLFGEHARELISPESGIYFLKSALTPALRGQRCSRRKAYRRCSVRRV